MRVPSIWWQSMPRGKGCISRSHAAPVGLMAIDAAMQGLHFARPGISGGLTSGGVGPVASGVFLPNLFVCTPTSALPAFDPIYRVRVRLRFTLKVAAEHCPAGGPDFPPGGLTSRRGACSLHARVAGAEAKLGLGLGVHPAWLAPLGQSHPPSQCYPCAPVISRRGRWDRTASPAPEEGDPPLEKVAMAE